MDVTTDKAKKNLNVSKAIISTKWSKQTKQIIFTSAHKAQTLNIYITSQCPFQWAPISSYILLNLNN